MVAEKTKSSFNPNALTFADGEKRVRMALDKTGFAIGRKILTSKDKEAVELANLLSVNNVPGGFRKWQLPLVLERSQLFISVGSPGVKVPVHSHDEGDGIRFIAGGSIVYNGQELTAGDWMYIPKAVSIHSG